MDRSRRKFLASVPTAAALLGVQGLQSCGGGGTGPAVVEPPPARPPNIIFFLVDDQRNDTLGCAGHPIIKTPVIDALAARGTRFRNAFVTTSICAASRASIFTGMYERSHGYTFNTPPIKAEYLASSYPLRLKAAGYRSAFIGKLGVDMPSGSTAGMFDSFVAVDRTPYITTLPDGSKIHETDLAANHAIEFLRTTPSEQPFCLNVSFNAVHAEDGDLANLYPWPPSADKLYEGIEIPQPRLSDPAIFNALPDFLKASINRERFFWCCDSPESYQKNMRAYFRMISGVDNAIGRVLAELSSRGLDRNTVVIYMADNGYYMGDRGFAGKWSHYEQSLRVPLIIADPRVSAGQRAQLQDSMALNVDIASTILGLAGQPLPGQYQGANLTPLLASASANAWRKDFFCEHLMVDGGIPKWEGVRDERYVYARYFEQSPVYEFLHDLQTDPDQLRNFVADPTYRSVLVEMRTRCDALKLSYTPR